ncbi:MAG: 50S ribosomal protein L17 [Erysipelothrix sp.]|nr:50S ribosomal protein L17 [Erysipelothrix sp.]
MKNRKLGRASDQRKAMLRNLATSLVMNRKITTTQHRALELRSIADKLVTWGKQGDVAARREAAKVLFNVKDPKTGKTALQILFEDIAPTYVERSGGYTRVTKTVQRSGDAAEMAEIEFV